MSFRESSSPRRKPRTRYLTSLLYNPGHTVDSEVAFLVATEKKLPELSTIDFDICRTKRKEGAVYELDCSSRNLTGEFPIIFLSPPKPPGSKNSVRSI